MSVVVGDLSAQWLAITQPRLTQACLRLSHVEDCRCQISLLVYHNFQPGEFALPRVRVGLFNILGEIALYLVFLESNI
jgi:hypothetical protein